MNRGHLFSLQPRVNTAFSPQAFEDARRELADVSYGSIDEAARAVAERALDSGDEMRRRLEAKGNGIADVQVPDTASGRFNLPRLGHDVANGVRELVDTCSNGNGRGSLEHGHIHFTASPSGFVFVPKGLSCTMLDTLPSPREP